MAFMKSGHEILQHKHLRLHKPLSKREINNTWLLKWKPVPLCCAFQKPFN